MRPSVSPASLTLADPIPFGHKFALRPIPAGGPVVKYGETVGLATEDIAAGQHVHVHNVEGIKGRGDKMKQACLENDGAEILTWVL